MRLFRDQQDIVGVIGADNSRDHIRRYCRHKTPYRRFFRRSQIDAVSLDRQTETREIGPKIAQVINLNVRHVRSELIAHASGVGRLHHESSTGGEQIDQFLQQLEPRFEFEMLDDVET